MRAHLLAILLATPALAGCLQSGPPVDDVCHQPEGCAFLPAFEQDPEVRLLVNDTYQVGERATVEAKNIGKQTYTYRTYYAACDLRYYTADGRQFLVPPGTHCDIVNSDTLEPGETAELFSWNLTECTEDNWGCAESEPLPPGRYYIWGSFPVEGDRARNTTTVTSFEILGAEG